MVIRQSLERAPDREAQTISDFAGVPGPLTVIPAKAGIHP
jgi:hypothetical protein